MATLTMQNVTKIFGRNVIAVKEFNLEVKEREFLVLLGPSGCGKTTAMRMVAGLEEVTTGEIFIGDREVTELPPRKRNVSMIFQNYAVWPHMTVYDNIAFALKLKNMDKDEIDKIVKETAGMAKIDMLLDRLMNRSPTWTQNFGSPCGLSLKPSTTRPAQRPSLSLMINRKP